MCPQESYWKDSKISSISLFMDPIVFWTEKMSYNFRIMIAVLMLGDSNFRNQRIKRGHYVTYKFFLMHLTLIYFFKMNLMCPSWKAENWRVQAFSLGSVIWSNVKSLIWTTCYSLLNCKVWVGNTYSEEEWNSVFPYKTNLYCPRFPHSLQNNETPQCC